MKKDNIKLGILMITMSALSFTFMHFFAKLCPEVPVTQKIFARNFISLFIALIPLWKRQIYFPKLPTESKDKFLLFIRCFAGILGVILNFYAITVLPLAESTILNRLSPFYVIIFASFFLKEYLRKIDLAAIVIVFIFVLLIVKPGFNLYSFAAICGLLSGVCAGGAYTTLRALRNKVDPATIIFYFSLFSVIFMLPFSINFIIPNWHQLLILIGIGIAASCGQFFITYAYKFAPATKISVFNYLGVVFSILLDIFILAIIPDHWSAIGCTGIITVAILLFLYDRKCEDNLEKQEK